MYVSDGVCGEGSYVWWDLSECWVHSFQGKMKDKRRTHHTKWHDRHITVTCILPPCAPACHVIVTWMSPACGKWLSHDFTLYVTWLSYDLYSGPPQQLPLLPHGPEWFRQSRYWRGRGLSQLTGHDEAEGGSSDCSHVWYWSSIQEEPSELLMVWRVDCIGFVCGGDPLPE